MINFNKLIVRLWYSPLNDLHNFNLDLMNIEHSNSFEQRDEPIPFVAEMNAHNES